MAKGSGYFEHDVKVRYTEGLIDKSNDWQWFVDYIEARFEAPKEISAVGEFDGVFSSVSRPYIYLAGIVDAIGDFKPEISIAWLKKLYDCVLLRCGLLRPEEFGEREGFYGLLGVASYATFLFNKLTGSRRPFDARVLYYSNLHQLFDFDVLRDDWARLRDLSERVELPGIECVAETLRANLEGIDAPVNDERVSALMDANFDADFLSFKHIEGELFQPWQEALLRDALKLSFVDGEIVPFISYGNETESSDVCGWTEDMFLRAKGDFRDERAVCVLETVELGKWKKVPSKRSQAILVDLAVNHAKDCLAGDKLIFSLRCTAFNVLEHLASKKMLDREIVGSYSHGMSELLKGLTEYDDLRFMKDHSLPMSSEQKGFLQAKTASFFKDGLDRVDTSWALIDLYRNPLSAQYCSQEDAERSLDLFCKLAAEVDTLTPELFYAAMTFFLDVLGNQNVDSKWTRCVIIFLRHAWQDKYYSRVVSGMQEFTYEQSVPTEMIRLLNEQFLVAPQSLARPLMLLSDDAILKVLEAIAEHIIVYQVSRVTISEYYPDHVHVRIKDDARSIDKMIADEVKRVYKERSYRLLNGLSEQEMFDGFFNRLATGVQVACEGIDVAPVYDEIVRNAPKQYEFLPNPGAKPTLGHLTQLFPLLENLIRDIGEFFDIVPFQADKMSFNKLKEVSGVLSDLIGNVRGLTGTIQGCSEFVFVYYVMYSSNGFNVRNDCIHGHRYQDPADVALAYRLTVICTYMMMKRLRGLEAIAKGDEE